MHGLIAEVGPVARSCLSRAAGQRGRLALPIELETLETKSGQIQPCNAGTLFEIDWRVDRNGRIHLTGFVDGVAYTHEAVL